ncbi:DNA binding protein [Pectobacterium phage My1]|uniref:Putative D3 protein n=1 Tax=Pectobacterium phage My1 TaxID=1204539 RepID=J9QGR8_9CAUD|nr:DNA binding protein [Pectobacterium phage My1]AFQ22265.1 putative D3 protein [Pectobacterium phage My1]
MAAVTQWTEELFNELASEYQSKINAYPEDERGTVSMEIVNEVAKAAGVTANGLRIKLTNAGLYVRKTTVTKPAATKGESKSGGARTSKADAHSALRGAFSDAGLEDGFLDDEIIDKLTGKAALHLAEAVRKITK